MSQPMQSPAEDDQAAAAAVRRHHAELAAGVDQRGEALLHHVEGANLPEAELARQELLTYVRGEVIPHAAAEEQTMYPAAAARPEGGPLITAMLDEHRTLIGLVGELADADSTVRAAATARALATLFASHLAKENDLVLPMLLATPGVSLSALLAGMHELLGGDAAAGSSG